jgi:uncharacterized protein involved in exopolysaccharide biosynthesis
MVERDPNQQPERDPATDDENDGVDFERVKETLGFVLRAARRRPKLVAIVFALVAATGVTYAVTMPRTYHSQVKLLAQANLVVPALSNPDRSVPRDADSPTKNVADQILRRDNLIALAEETDLVERSFATRSPLTRLKDALLGEDATDEQKLTGIAETLEKKFSITVQNNNVIIGVDWDDPHVAYELVTLVQKNFLSARYDNEVAMVSDAIAVLQEHEKVEAAGVDAALDEYKKITDKPSAGAAATPVPREPPAPRVARPAASSPTGQTIPTIDPEVAAALEDKRQQIRSLETGRQRELETLRAQLAQAQLTLTPQHPTVIALQQKVDTLSAPDPQLVQLRAEERALMARIAPPLAPQGATGTAPPPLAPFPAAAGTRGIPALPAPHQLTPQEDPQTQLARSKLEGAIRRDQEAVARIEAANMELEVARTAFKYRYTVVTPAEVARAPRRPVAPLVGVASVIGAALLALLLAAGADQRSGRILEEWQVERRLKLEVLGEFDPTMHVPTRPL